MIGWHHRRVPPGSATLDAGAVVARRLRQPPEASHCRSLAARQCVWPCSLKYSALYSVPRDQLAASMGLTPDSEPGAVKASSTVPVRGGDDSGGECPGLPGRQSRVQADRSSLATAASHRRIGWRPRASSRSRSTGSVVTMAPPVCATASLACPVPPLPHEGAQVDADARRTGAKRRRNRRRARASHRAR